MRRAAPILLLFVVLEATGTAFADKPPSPPSLPACVGVKSEARWVPYGYNHVVTITNGCTRAAACVVSTDVNPERQSTTVAPGATSEVTTFLGSPAAVFTPKVSCSLR